MPVGAFARVTRNAASRSWSTARLARLFGADLMRFAKARIRSRSHDRGVLIGAIQKQLGHPDHHDRRVPGPHQPAGRAGYREVRHVDAAELVKAQLWLHGAGQQTYCSGVRGLPLTIKNIAGSPPTINATIPITN